VTEPRLPRLSDLDHGNVECPTCLGEGWVCEAHPAQAWGGGDGCCGAAGMPCACNGITIYEKRRRQSA